MSWPEKTIVYVFGGLTKPIYICNYIWIIMLKIIAYALVLPVLALAGAIAGGFFGLNPLYGGVAGIIIGLVGMAILISILSTLFFLIRVLVFGGFLLIVVALGAYFATLLTFNPIIGGVVGLVIGLIAMSQIIG
ncbi:hypothetical protein [Methanonatronarchaeum sp. AMET-Sl]|uniref:hypothetical protein n=1 Tax=Methanonatronarchaeum sp. AMET-Sl TaxID=3037654 RepID=UPI00244E4A19|nr:hypothetical protein [Methanonatronarchaeum sp. AMET-Sl]WGI16914.1 hypothetical protein QEN48_05290 [Methanonatronarchaeum sp. AMET-Sl]